MSRTRLLLSLLLATVLVVPLLHSPPAVAEDGRTATWVGSLQDELGCPGDWQPDCDATALADPDQDGTYTATFAVPAGTYEYKVAINEAWDESYGPEGGSGNGPLVLQGPTDVTVSYDDATHRTDIVPTELPGTPVTDADSALFTPSLRTPLTEERFYFVMADRFANGDPSNDRGGLTGGRLETGFDPTDKGFYHGGDLRGLINKLDYIEGLGTTAIWLTPSFKNRPVQGSGADASAGYHGYWVTDFTRIDPHLGTNADMAELIDKAHARGMKVFFDIITNHTADVIDYAEGEYTYISKETEPYRDADGQVFDDRDYAGTDDFPELDPETSFPYTPVFRTEADASVKVPGWLNDRTLYHNRGDSTFAGESSTYGDFIGLDDLFTEHPRVVDGMTDIYSTWVDLGVDGFRIDTAKHVNMEFWQQFSPALLEHAEQGGNDDFFMFGEVFDANPEFMSRYSTTGKLPATLDFGFQSAAAGVAGGSAPTRLRDLYAGDDYYTDTDSNAYSAPTFLGNHDMGRLAMMLAGSSYQGDALEDRVTLAHELMYLTRGQPVVYYGDEQGMIGAGGDKDARQDLFATQTEQYAEEPNLYGSGSRDRYDTSTPLYTKINELAELRETHPALADGAQVTRYAAAEPGIFAISRIDPAQEREYLVVINNATTERTADFDTYASRTDYGPIYGSEQVLRSRADGRVTVTMPPLSVAVWKAVRAPDASAAAPAVHPAVPGNGDDFTGRAEIAAALGTDAFAQVSFGWRPAGTDDWRPLGTDDSTPYRIFHDVSGVATGTLVEYRIVAKDLDGRIAAASTSGIVGSAGEGGSEPPPGTGPVTQPDAASIPGNHNTEMGCPGDWQPDCAQAQLTLDPDDQIWKGQADVPAGDYEYKIAIENSWDENYGAGGQQNGPNIPYSTAGGPIDFYFDYRTKITQNTAQGPIITAPGSFQSEQGCPADWSPDCMRTWLTDADGDGTYTWTGVDIPAGSWEFKITHNLSWEENYGAGGEPNGANIGFTVPDDGQAVTMTYRISDHRATVTVSDAGGSPDLGQQKAHWVEPDLLAWPADDLPDGTDPAALDWTLYASADAELAVSGDNITGGTGYQLSYDPDGLPEEIIEAHPQLDGYLALRLDTVPRGQVKKLLTEQLAVAVHDDRLQLLDASGVQIPLVLDSLYAEDASQTSYGISWSGPNATFRLWAPTARDVDLLTWGPDSPGDAPITAATRTPMTRAEDGSWSATRTRLPGGSRYLYEVTVYQPTTGEVEINRVTDPYSIALTLNSTRSVAIDIADPRFKPRIWEETPAPEVERAVDHTIYELHVRDFSINDEAVPEDHRGSYLAFADDGNGRRHLQALADAGLNTVHLLPTFDIASIEEDPAEQREPDCDLEALPPDSEQQQACVAEVADADGFNWGYDPWHWMAPEGSYASTPEAADGGARIAEFRTMVGALHADGLQVVLDQVYNHTPAAGQAEHSVLDKIVPGYYQRLNAVGEVQTSTCCSNIATEHAMAEKIMVDSTVHWAKQYKVDGFRFDLMGHHSRANMLAVRAALDELTLAEDGVDGSSIYIYGEGWNFGEVADNALFTQATQGQLGGTGIGTFSDRLRDAVRGGGPFDEDPRLQGFATGLGTDPNAADQGDVEARLINATDLVQLGLAGNLRDFTFTSAGGGEVSGDEVDYNGQPAGYAEQPDEVITYVDAHDNETLFDILTYKLPADTPMDQRVRMNTVALSTTALAQTPSFWHAGTDLLRSKSLDRNSYNSGDWFNTLDWTGEDNGFGHGLPPAADNQDKWPYQQPLLADTALKPTQAEVQTATAQAQDLLRLRFSTRLFRLGDAELIKQKVSYPVSGTELAHDGVIVMQIDDTVGPDVDSNLERVVVVFNASPDAVQQQLPDLAGQDLRLSEIQADGSDPVVRQSTWNAGSGTLTVPARTVAVYVQPS